MLIAYNEFVVISLVSVVLERSDQFRLRQESTAVSVSVLEELAIMISHVVRRSAVQTV